MSSFALQRVGDIVIDKVRLQMRLQNRNASGKTSAAIRKEVKGFSVKVFAPFHVRFLNDGRKKTVNDGTGELVRALKDWCKARGIPEDARFAIAAKIHKEGYKGDNVINNIITQELLEEIRAEMSLSALDVIKKTLGIF